MRPALLSVPARPQSPFGAGAALVELCAALELPDVAQRLETVA